MEKVIAIRRISLVFIIGISLCPGIIGPAFNLGQFAGSTDQTSSILLSALFPMVLGSFIAYRFLNFVLNRRNQKVYSSKFQLILEVSLINFCTFLIAWIICETGDLIIDMAFLGLQNQSWLDVLLWLPILTLFALFPCAIATLIYGGVLFIVLKND